MKQVYLENRGARDDSEHSKFFELTDDGDKVISRWGPIGAEGQSKVIIESDDEEARKAAYDKKLQEKLRGKKDKKTGLMVPYVIIRQNTVNGIENVENRPSAEGRRYGVEVEVHSNVDITSVIGKLRERGIAVSDQRNRYFHSRGDGNEWDVKYDSSCGFEFASPIVLGERGIFDCKLAVEKIREVCPSATNARCGIHVTVDVADISPEKRKVLVIGLMKAQDHFYAMCADHRQNNQYCKRHHTDLDMLVGMSYERIRTSLRFSDRYHGFNFANFESSHPRIEFRMMEAHVQERKLGKWIRTCVGFVDGMIKTDYTFNTGRKFTSTTFNSIVDKNWTRQS